MRTASEHLVQTTWMNDHHLFANHDRVTPINWVQVFETIDDVETNHYDHHQLVLIAVLEFLCDSPFVEVSLDEIAQLPELERRAVVEALQMKWSAKELQENL